MSKYTNTFIKILNEQQEEMTPDEIENADGDEALDSTFDDSTVDTDDFAVDAGGIVGLRSKHLQKFKDIIAEFEQFAQYLNSDQSDSVNKFLNAIDRDGSIFSGVSRETNKVTTVAESLAALAEAMRGYVLTGQRKQREQEAALSEY